MCLLYSDQLYCLLFVFLSNESTCWLEHYYSPSMCFASNDTKAAYHFLTCYIEASRHSLSTISNSTSWLSKDSHYVASHLPNKAITFLNMACQTLDSDHAKHLPPSSLTSLSEHMPLTKLSVTLSIRSSSRCPLLQPTTQTPRSKTIPRP